MAIAPHSKNISMYRFQSLCVTITMRELYPIRQSITGLSLVLDAFSSVTRMKSKLKQLYDINYESYLHTGIKTEISQY